MVSNSVVSIRATCNSWKEEGKELAVLFETLSENCQNPTQLNSTQCNSNITNVGVRHSSHVYPTHPTPPPPPTPPLPQTFQPLLDQLESWNFAQTLTRPIWLNKHNFNPTNYWGGVTNPSPRINPYNLIGTKIFF